MKDYLFRENLTVKKFAADLEISTSYLYQLLREERKPSRHLAHKIEKYTKGELTVKKLLDEAQHKKMASQNGLNLETHENRIANLEAHDQINQSRFDLIEKRLSKLEQERET